MEPLLFIASFLLVAEWVLALTWAEPYYRWGIPVYERTTSAAAPTGIEWHLAPEPGFWRGASVLVYRRLSFHQLLFRESAFTRMMGIHGRIEERRDGRHRIVVYTDLWPHLMWIGACAALLSDGEFVGAATVIGLGAGWTILQRVRSDRIRRTIEAIA